MFDLGDGLKSTFVGGALAFLLIGVLQGKVSSPISAENARGAFNSVNGVVQGNDNGSGTATSARTITLRCSSGAKRGTLTLKVSGGSATNARFTSKFKGPRTLKIYAGGRRVFAAQVDDSTRLGITRWSNKRHSIKC